jgi:hypothetical protein
MGRHKGEKKKRLATEAGHFKFVILHFTFVIDRVISQQVNDKCIM